MFDSESLSRLKPIAAFFAVYTVLFYFTAATLKYTFPFLAGFLLALLLQAPVRFLKSRLRFRAGAASAAVTVLLFFLLFALLFLLGFWLVNEITNLLFWFKELAEEDFASKITAPLNELLDKLKASLGKIDAGFLQKNGQQIWNLTKTGMDVATSLLTGVLRFLTSLPAIFTMLMVMIFSTYFFSKDMPGIQGQLMSLFSAGAAGHIRAASRHSLKLAGKYITSYLMIYGITFLETLVVFAALRVPYPLVLSLVAGLSDILPVLGPGVVYVPLCVLFLLEGRVFGAAALLCGWLLVCAVRQVIEPKIVSASINIHPLWMLASLYFSLVSGNFWILIYISLLLVLYQVLKQAGILPPLVPQDSPKRPVPK